jgi:hypothetical protein
MGNYVIGMGKYVIVSPSQLGNYKIADTQTPTPRRGGREVIIFFDGDELIVEHINVRVIHESAG